MSNDDGFTEIEMRRGTGEGYRGREWWLPWVVGAPLGGDEMLDVRFPDGSVERHPVTLRQAQTTEREMGHEYHSLRMNPMIAVQYHGHRVMLSIYTDHLPVRRPTPA